MVEKILQLAFGECALFGLRLVLLDVPSGVPVEEDLGWVSAEQCLADAVPAVVRIADIGAEGNSFECSMKRCTCFTRASIVSN